jgi:hypothetical protein
MADNMSGSAAALMSVWRIGVEMRSSDHDVIMEIACKGEDHIIMNEAYRHRGYV